MKKSYLSLREIENLSNDQKKRFESMPLFLMRGFLKKIQRALSSSTLGTHLGIVQGPLKCNSRILKSSKVPCIAAEYFRIIFLFLKKKNKKQNFLIGPRGSMQKKQAYHTNNQLIARELSHTREGTYCRVILRKTGCVYILIGSNLLVN